MNLAEAIKLIEGSMSMKSTTRGKIKQNGRASFGAEFRKFRSHRPRKYAGRNSVLQANGETELKSVLQAREYVRLATVNYLKPKIALKYLNAALDMNCLDMSERRAITARIEQIEGAI